MRYLVHMKLFNKENISTAVNGGTAQATEEKYSLAPPARYLIRGSEQSLVASILMNDEDVYAAWHLMKDSFTGNCNAFEKAIGSTYTGYLNANPEKNQILNEAMACYSRVATSGLVNECKGVFSDGISTLVDVGGGTGTVVKAISKAFPNIKCTLFDLPRVIANLPEIPNITKISGDMFKSIPNADAILFKNVLHDWSDDQCVQILKRCKEAASPGGKVIINLHPYAKLRLASDLEMMVTNGGKDRTEQEWKTLIDAAGFASYKITQMSAGFASQSVIEAYIDDRRVL
ncbi:hypothetical protein MKW94_019368 [Papaver nudicaule]|uniref:O-methyltransferase C-terminal domain-containing protein n=1 Tax=Papaver nudicaule TaxID=74823 RepID=A0AA41S5T8_PAPNU|nr:hypothetical protein [Papaver nudicaule]